MKVSLATAFRRIFARADRHRIQSAGFHFTLPLGGERVS
jgi:hypothetical protein